MASFSSVMKRSPTCLADAPITTYGSVTCARPPYCQFGVSTSDLPLVAISTAPVAAFRIFSFSSAFRYDPKPYSDSQRVGLTISVASIPLLSTRPTLRLALIVPPPSSGTVVLTMRLS